MSSFKQHVLPNNMYGRRRLAALARGMQDEIALVAETDPDLPASRPWAASPAIPMDVHGAANATEAATARGSLTAGPTFAVRCGPRITYCRGSIRGWDTFLRVELGREIPKPSPAAHVKMRCGPRTTAAAVPNLSAGAVVGAPFDSARSERFASSVACSTLAVFARRTGADSGDKAESVALGRSTYARPLQQRHLGARPRMFPRARPARSPLPHSYN
jgi:hypothetical protein